MSIETTNYETDSLIAGQVITRDDVPLAADTYYIGMPLKLAVGVYGYDAADPEAIYIGPNARVLGAPGQGSIIAWGEVLAGGIVDDAGVALTITDAIIQAAQSHGIFIKNKKTA